MVTKELLQKGDSLNRNIQLFRIDFFFSDFANNPESRVNKKKLCLNIAQTRFILPFNNPKKTPPQAKNEIENLLKALDADTLIFLNHIQKIEYLLPDSSLGYIERVDLGENKFEIRVQSSHEIMATSSFFLKFDKHVVVDDEEEDIKGINCRIAIAFKIELVNKKNKTNKQDDASAVVESEWTIVPITPGSVCIYFPAEKETSNLRFHIHAPFASTVARDSVRNCGGNNILRDNLADLLAESMHKIRDYGLLSVNFLSLLPNDKDN